MVGYFLVWGLNRADYLKKISYPVLLFIADIKNFKTALN